MLVALAVWPAGHNPFGPAKAFATFAAATVAWMCVVLVPGGRTRLVTAVRTPLGASALALAAVVVLSLVTTVDMRASVFGQYPGYAGIASGAAWLSIGLAAACMPGEMMRRAAGRAATLTLVVLGAYALLQRMGVQPIALASELDADRVGSLAGNAANLGVLTALLLPAALDRFAAETGWRWRACATAALALGTLASAFAGSRGGWLGLLAAAGVWWLLSRGSAHTPRAVAGAVGIVTLLVLAIALTPASAERVTGGGTATDTARGRVAVWAASASLIADRPVLGWGTASFGRVFPAYATTPTVDPVGRAQSLDDPHNVLLSVAVAQGLAGAVALAALTAGAFMALRRVKASLPQGWRAAIAGGLAGGAVALQFHFVTLETGALIALLAGALASPAGEVDEGEAPAWWGIVPAVGMALCAVLAFGAVRADTLMRTGFAAATAGDRRVAMAAFDEAAGAAPFEPAVGWARGRAMVALVTAGGANALADGEAALRGAAERMPGDSRPLRDLGDLYVAGAVSGDVRLAARAISAYDAALALAPLDVRALLGRGVAYSLAGDLSSAERDITRAVTLAPGFTDAWENLAAVYDAMGDGERAHAARTKALESRR